MKASGLAVRLAVTRPGAALDRACVRYLDPVPWVLDQERAREHREIPVLVLRRPGGGPVLDA